MSNSFHVNPLCKQVNLQVMEATNKKDYKPLLEFQNTKKYICLEITWKNFLNRPLMENIDNMILWSESVFVYPSCKVGACGQCEWLGAEHVCFDNITISIIIFHSKFHHYHHHNQNHIHYQNQTNLWRLLILFYPLNAHHVCLHLAAVPHLKVSSNKDW